MPNGFDHRREQGHGRHPDEGSYDDFTHSGSGQVEPSGEGAQGPDAGGGLNDPLALLAGLESSALLSPREDDSAHGEHYDAPLGGPARGAAADPLAAAMEGAPPSEARATPEDSSELSMTSGEPWSHSIAEPAERTLPRYGVRIALILAGALLVGAGVTAVLWYRSHRALTALEGELRAAHYRASPAGHHAALAAAEAILDRRKGDPEAQAAVAFGAAAVAIELGEDRRDTARKYLAKSRGADSHWRTAAEGYLTLIQDPARAAGYLRKGAEVYGESAIIRHLRGRTLSAMGDRPGAAKAFEQAIALAPHYLAPRIALAILSAEGEEGPEAALAALGEIIREKPDHVEALVQRARLAVSNGIALSQAQEDAERVVGPLAERAGRAQLAWAQLTLARLAHGRGDVDGVTAALDAALKVPPCCDPVYRYELAGALMSLYRFVEALEQTEAALRLSGKAPQYLLRAARLYLELGKPTQAAAHIARTPEHLPQARVLRGRLAIAVGKWQRAHSTLGRVADEGGTHGLEASMYSALALAMEDPSQVEQADAQLKALRRAHPRDERIVRIMAQVAMRAGSPGEAESLLRAAWRLNGLDPRTATELGKVALLRGHLLSAKKRFHTALRRRPDHAPAQIGLATVALARGELGAARKAADSVAEAARDAPAYLGLLARIELAAGEFESAENFIERAHAAGAASSTVEGLRGKLALHRGRLRQAVVALSGAHASRPNDIELFLDLARAYRLLGKWESADRVMEMAAGVDNSHPAVLIELGRLAVEDGALAEAIEYADRALTEGERRGAPGKLAAAAHTLRARAYLAKKDTGRAITNLQDAIELDEGAGEAYLVMGMTYDALERPGRAAPYYEKALNRDSARIDARFFAGRAYLASGQQERAAKLLESYLASAPKTAPHRREAARLLRRGR